MDWRSHRAAPDTTAETPLPVAHDRRGDSERAISSALDHERPDRAVSDGVGEAAGALFRPGQGSSRRLSRGLEFCNRRQTAYELLMRAWGRFAIEFDERVKQR